MNSINIINYGCSSHICTVIFSWFKKVINCIVKNTNLASSHPSTQSLNGSEERGEGRERGGLKEKGCREKKEYIKRKRWRETWQARFVTLNRADSACMRKLRRQRKEQLQVTLYLDCHTHF